MGNQPSSSTLSSYLSSDSGSLKSVTETFAFPNNVANDRHMKTDLHSYKKIKFAILDNYEKPINGKVIIFCHGNCMTVNESTIYMLNRFHESCGIVICMLEYPGYGESKDQGTPSAESCVGALHQMVNYLKEQGYTDKDIYFIGHSIGTGVVSQYINQNVDRQFGGMVLLSPYKSILSVVINNDMLEFTSSSLNFYKTQNIIANIKIPILIVHGKQDNVIDVSHSDKLKELNSNIKLYKLDGVDHNNILQSRICINLISSFVNYG